MILRIVLLFCLTAFQTQLAALCADAKQYSATLQSEDLMLTFAGDARGIRLSSIRDVRTGTEYLVLMPPSLGASSPGSQPGPYSIANPFAIAVLGQSVRTLEASKDTDILRWTATPGRLRVEFQFRGLLLTGELTVSVGRTHIFWQCRLHNDSSEALQAVFYFPAFSGAAVSAAYAPVDSGVSLRPIPQTPFRAAYGDQLAAPVAVFHSKDQGLYLVDNGRTDLAPTATDCYARELLMARTPPSQTEGAGVTESAVLGIANALRMGPGKSLTIGPVILGCYQGPWTAGLEKARLARAHLFRPHSAPRWLRSLAVLATAETSLADIPAKLQSAGAGALILTGLPGPEDGEGQPAGLRALADQVHASGAKLILAVNARSISQKSRFAQTTDAQDIVCRDAAGKPLEPQPGLWAMCAADPRWQARVADTCARLVRSYGADGIALTGLGRGWSAPCYASSHRHPTPFIANWGLRNLLRAVRSRLDRISPDLVLVSSCAADFAREYADAVIIESAEDFHSAPPAVTRTLCPGSLTYLLLPNDISSAEAACAWALAGGIGVVVDLSAEAVPPGLSRLLQYAQAVPDLLTAPAVPLEGAAVSPSVCVCAFAGARTIIAAANLGDDPYSEGLALPDSINSLEAPLSKLVVRRGPDGRFPTALMPRRACLWIAQ